jgi:hypothetical protein
MALTHPQLARFTAPRVAAVCGLLLVVAAVGAVAWHAHTPGQPQAAPGDAWAGYTHRWTRLPPPPQPRTGVALAWTGNELLSLGGEVPGVGPPARDGYAFDPRSGHWSHIPPAPGPGRTDAYAVWTGSEVLLTGGYGDGNGRPANVALDPATNSWRRIATAPVSAPPDALRVWTGHALIVWGADRGSHPSRSGAAYVPVSGRWHRIADAPIALNSATGAWTGSRMIVFGSSLDGTNRSATPAPIGASYDPGTNTWQQLPPSTLAPEASSIGWIGRRLVAWDYEGDTQDYSPSANRWSATSQHPFGFGECYPQSVVTSTVMFAWFCGKAATVGASPGSWTLASGGVTAATVTYGGTRLKRYQTASLAPAGAVIALAATGIVVKQGSPCFGCKRSPVTYWAYRARLAPAIDRTPSLRQSASLHLAAGPQNASVRVTYPRFGDTFTIIAARPRSALITGYLEVDGRQMSGFTCRSAAQATCRAGPFEGLERGAASRTWYLHITKHTRAPADVSVTVHFRRP